MKRFLILSLILSLVSGVSSVNAASVGGKQPDQGKFAAGFEYNQIIKKDVNSNPVLNAEVTDSKQYLTKIEYGLLGSDLFNWSVFTKLGMADIELKESDTKSPYDEEFAWGLGSKLVYNLEACKIGVEGQYFAIDDLSTTRNLGSGDKLDTKWKEWQVSFFAAKDFEFENFSLMPYLGVRYSDLSADTDYYDASAGSTTSYDVEADENFGMFVGTDINITENISVNLEGRFIDESAVSVCLAYKF